MKNRSILFLILLLISSTIYAQVPSGINYQAVARDADGTILTDQTMSFLIELTNRDGKSMIHYAENHTVTSNDLGLVNFAIGRGEVLSGSFSNVPWSKGHIWVQLSLDKENDGTYELMGTSELLSVPYAMYAQTAAELATQGTSTTPQDDLFEEDEATDAARTYDCSNEECPCIGGIRKIYILYNGPTVGEIAVFQHNPNGTPIQVFSNVNDRDSLVIQRSNPNFNLAINLVFRVRPVTGSDSAEYYICYTNTCGQNTVGQSFNTLSILGREDARGNECTIDEGNPAWTLRGNVLQAPVNKLGTLNEEDVLLITSNTDRGIWTKDGDMGWGTIVPAAKLHVSGGQQIIDNPVNNGNPNQEVGYGLVVNSPQQGIMIKLTAKDGRSLPLTNTAQGNQPGNDNHFITFRGANGEPLGRIEGEKGADPRGAEYTNDADWVLELQERDDDLFYANAAVGIASVDEVLAISNAVQVGIDIVNEGAALASSGACAAVDPCLTPVLVTSKTAKIAVLVVRALDAATNLTNASVALGYAVSERDDITDANQTARDNRVTYRGVVYASGGADYAEYLERANDLDLLKAGDLVGVHGGKISHRTDNAFEYRVITTNPVVLGNMPEPGKEDLYERVGFLGQVPVKVKGMVQPGDYILPSGLNDGFGIAKKANEMEIEDFPRIVGRAWSSKSTSGAGKVNIAIGLNSNDIAVISRKQQDQIDQLTGELDKVRQMILQIQNGSIPQVEEQVMPTTELTFDPHAVKVLFEVIRTIAEIDPSFIGPQEVVENPLMKLFILNEDQSDAFVASISQMMKAYGYTILSEHESTRFASMIPYNSDFLNMDPNSMRDTFSNMDLSKVEDPRLIEMLTDQEAQERAVKAIEIGQAVTRVLLDN